MSIHYLTPANQALIQAFCDREKVDYSSDFFHSLLDTRTKRIIQSIKDIMTDKGYTIIIKSFTNLGLSQNTLIIEGNAVERKKLVIDLHSNAVDFSVSIDNEKVFSPKEGSWSPLHACPISL